MPEEDAVADISQPAGQRVGHQPLTPRAADGSQGHQGGKCCGRDDVVEIAVIEELPRAAAGSAIGGDREDQRAEGGHLHQTDRGQAILIAPLP